MRNLNVVLVFVVLLALISPSGASAATLTTNATPVLFADSDVGKSVGKFVKFVNDNWVIVLLLVVTLMVVFMWNRQANAPTGTWSGSPFVILIVGIIIGIFICSGFKGEAVTPEKVDDPNIGTKSGDPVGKPSEFVDLKGNTLERNDKALPANWEVAYSQEDGKAGFLITKANSRVIDPAKPIYLYFSPDQKALAGRGALGTMKYK